MSDFQLFRPYRVPRTSKNGTVDT